MALTTDRVPAIKDIPPKTPATPCEQVQAEIAKYSDWDANIMQAIARAENRECNPKKHNLTASETHRRADGSVICVGSYSVLQVGCLHYREGEDRDDLATNVRIAHRVWQDAGYKAWSCFNNGAYREFLK